MPARGQEVTELADSRAKSCWSHRRKSLIFLLRNKS